MNETERQYLRNIETGIYSGPPDLLQRDSKTIHQELWDPLLYHIQHEQNVFVNEEMLIIIFHHNLHLKIFKFFDKLSSMIYIELLMKFSMTLLSLR